MRTLIHGDSLTQGAIQEELIKADLLITFFGTVFDMPHLQTCFTGLQVGLPHFDLCFAARRVGLRGGLKSIEKDLNIARESDLLDLDGMEAVRLWHQSRAGNDAALDQLVRYNAADTRNLEPLATSSTTNSPCDTDLPGRPPRITWNISRISGVGGLWANRSRIGPDHQSVRSWSTIGVGCGPWQTAWVAPWWRVASRLVVDILADFAPTLCRSIDSAHNHAEQQGHFSPYHDG